jgi:hypothetical protein
MSNSPSKNSMLPAELITAASAAGEVAAAILAASGNPVASVIPLVENLLVTSINAWVAAKGTTPTIADLEALLGDVKPNPPSA